MTKYTIDDDEFIINVEDGSYAKDTYPETVIIIKDDGFRLVYTKKEAMSTGWMYVMNRRSDIEGHVLTVSDDLNWDISKDGGVVLDSNGNCHASPEITESSFLHSPMPTVEKIAAAKRVMLMLVHMLDAIGNGTDKKCFMLKKNEYDNVKIVVPVEENGIRYGMVKQGIIYGWLDDGMRSRAPIEDMVYPSEIKYQRDHKGPVLTWDRGFESQGGCYYRLRQEVVRDGWVIFVNDDLEMRHKFTGDFTNITGLSNIDKNTHTYPTLTQNLESELDCLAELIKEGRTVMFCKLEGAVPCS